MSLWRKAIKKKADTQIKKKANTQDKKKLNTPIRRFLGIPASIRESRENLFNFIYSIVFIIQVISFLLLVIVFGTYTDKYFNIIDLVFIGSFSIYTISHFIEKPKNITNIYLFAVITVYLWLIAINSLLIPYLNKGPAEDTIKLITISIKIVMFVGVIISNKRGRNYLTGTLQLRPAQSFVIGFLFVILVGSLILSLPISVRDGEEISYIDALFTSTSAVCVTGLVVVDTGTYYTMFGQIVILMLIQIGGLGIMTFGSFISLIMGNKMSLTTQTTSLEIYDQDSLQDLKALIKTIIVGTFLIELVGAISLFLSIDKNLLAVPTTGHKIYFSIFHSISAFCNAGFSLRPDSLTGFASNGIVNVTVMSLIVLGGIGFPVMLNVRNYVNFKIKNKLSKRNYSNIVLELQTKVVMTVTITLILFGAGLFLMFEWDKIMFDKTIPQKILSSFFQSITTRTAGFNTVDMSGLQETTYLIFLILMLIGASPGSTGGGIKTTTYYVLVKTTIASIRGSKEVVAFEKRFNKDLISRAISIFFSYVFLIFVATIILLMTEEFKILPILFEVISAIATVGLSAGVTGGLTDIGRIVITIVMFAGRMGVLTFLLVFFKPLEDNRLKYPEETLSIG